MVWQGVLAEEREKQAKMAPSAILAYRSESRSIDTHTNTQTCVCDCVCAFVCMYVHFRCRIDVVYTAVIYKFLLYTIRLAI